jgi:hypothetical protein
MPPLTVLVDFPETRYYPQEQLVTWHPHGLLDDKVAGEILEFMEYEEEHALEPFNRYADLGAVTEVRLKVGSAFEFVKRRRARYRGPAVKSALFGETTVCYGIARMYEALMEGSLIQVRAFRVREKAAEWLEVPLSLLQPED